jgi:hypothetical protein
VREWLTPFSYPFAIDSKHKTLLSIMKNKDSIFRLLSLACLTIIPVYPNVAYALVNLSGLSYILTGLFFDLPVRALRSLCRDKWL